MFEAIARGNRRMRRQQRRLEFSISSIHATAAFNEVAEAKAALKATEADEATEREKVAEEGTEHWSFRGCC